MKNINKIGISIIWLFIGQPIFAYVDYDAIEPNLIYCPDKIECSKNNFESCLDVESKKYLEISIGTVPAVVKGIYHFKAAYSHYDNNIPAQCQYTIDGVSGFLVQFKLAANLKAYKSNVSKWDDYSGPSHCFSTDTAQCPLLVKPELAIYRKMGANQTISFLGIKTTANDIPLKDSIRAQRNHLRYFTINYDEAFTACQGVKQCVITINYSLFDDTGSNYPQYYNAGSVIVDMENHMKILDINTGPSHGSNGRYLLKKIEPFNAVQFVD